MAQKPSNADRAQEVADSLTALALYAGLKPHQLVQTLLVDLRHVCDSARLAFAEQDTIARKRYIKELE